VPSSIKDTGPILSAKIAPIIKVSAGEINRLLVKKKERSFTWLSRRMDMETSKKLNVLRGTPSKKGRSGLCNRA